MGLTCGDFQAPNIGATRIEKRNQLVLPQLPDWLKWEVCNQSSNVGAHGNYQLSITFNVVPCIGSEGE